MANVTDPIADFLTRVRNASKAGHRIVEIPASNLKKRITEILYEKGYILRYKFEDGEGPQGTIKIALKYDGATKQPVIREMQRVSRPGLRRYTASGETPPTFWASASLSVITPFDVDTMVTPRPFT